MNKIASVTLISILSIVMLGCNAQVDETPVEDAAKADNLTPRAMQTTPESGDTIATIKTNHGEMKVLLYTDLASETAKNFIELSKDGKYNNTIFHRVIQDFMIQGGDFTNRNGTGGYSYKGPGTSVPDEFGEGLTHIKGALSMANAGPNTGGSQFFIVQAAEGTKFLDGRHAIFGFVYEGIDVIDEIASVVTGTADKPSEDIVIEKIIINTK